MVTIHTHGIGQGQRSLASKVRDGRTDGQRRLHYL